VNEDNALQCAEFGHERGEGDVCAACGAPLPPKRPHRKYPDFPQDVQDELDRAGATVRRMRGES
jgi:hypothetical protein